MSPTTMWMYATSNPHLDAGGLPQLASTKEDYLQLVNPDIKKQLIANMLKAFRPDVEVPSCIPKPSTIKKNGSRRSTMQTEMQRPQVFLLLLTPIMNTVTHPMSGWELWI